MILEKCFPTFKEPRPSIVISLHQCQISPHFCNHVTLLCGTKIKDAAPCTYPSIRLIPWGNLLYPLLSSFLKFSAPYDLTSRRKEDLRPIVCSDKS
ncbi:hypothetical protein AVEN_152886-1 [Araneus ventricosus]|uniref:Uncharacterized protein n=1 Tax=Araneus ventricosus TaxID=182803 RepID=A0A4Y2ACS1_ARAVE|nr:hypothetical protein AVEN_152886-1 [Araneus ventricosus]